jgi:hypothetical protein
MASIYPFICRALVIFRVIALNLVRAAAAVDVIASSAAIIAK